MTLISTNSFYNPPPLSVGDYVSPPRLSSSNSALVRRVLLCYRFLPPLILSSAQEKPSLLSSIFLFPYSFFRLCRNIEMTWPLGLSMDRYDSPLLICESRYTFPVWTRPYPFFFKDATQIPFGYVDGSSPSRINLEHVFCGQGNFVFFPS